MANCNKCGAEYEEGTKFCPSCGEPIEQQEAPQAEQTKEQTSNQTGEGKSDFSAKLSALNNTKDSTADFDKNDIEQNKVMGILAYIGLLVLIPIFAAKESKFARYHANQGLILMILEVITAVISVALGWIPVLGVIISIVAYLASALFFVMMIIGIMNVVNGKAKELPVIGKYTILK